MKRAERLPSDNPREWIKRAQSNLVLAKSLVPHTYLEDYCFNA